MTLRRWNVRHVHEVLATAESDLEPDSFGTRIEERSQIGRRRLARIDLQRRKNIIEIARLALPQGLALAATEERFGRPRTPFAFVHRRLSSSKRP